MKAYTIAVKDDPDQGEVVVFGETSKIAKRQYNTTDLMFEDYMDVQILRAPQYDDMEGFSNAELALEQWHNGWRWFDMEYPDPDTATDSEFLRWYEENFDE